MRNHNSTQASNKSSGGENRWLEQCSRKSVFIASNSSHMPHPKGFKKKAFASTEDSSMLIYRHFPSSIFSKVPALPLDSGYMLFGKCSLGFSITSVHPNAIK